jgi:hypothetical protein
MSTHFTAPHSSAVLDRLRNRRKFDETWSYVNNMRLNFLCDICFKMNLKAYVIYVLYFEIYVLCYKICFERI